MVEHIKTLYLLFIIFYTFLTLVFSTGEQSLFGGGQVEPNYPKLHPSLLLQRLKNKTTTSLNHDLTLSFIHT